MPRTVSQIPALGHSGIDRIVKLYRKNRLKYYELSCRIIDNKESYYNIQTVSSLPAAINVNEATGLPFLDIRTPFNMILVRSKWAMGFSASWESIENDYYGVIQDRSINLMNSVEKAQDLDAAGFLVLATTGQIVTPDRVALASTAHLYQGGFYSNILSTNAALSTASLEQAMNEMNSQPDDTGDPMGFVGPYDLWVGPAQMGLAERLSGTTPNGRIPQSYNNDTDWAGKRIGNVIVNPYWNNSTTPFAWMLVARDASNPFLWITNGKVRMPTPQYDQYKDTVNGTALASWVKGVQDPRGIIYSAGS